MKPGSRLIDDNLQAWSAEAYEKCTKVLSATGIDVASRLIWISRNNRSASDENQAIDRSVAAIADYPNSQDFMISIIDGVLEVKRLRNKIGAHDVGEKILNLSNYDAENAFCLTRAVLLAVFGLSAQDELKFA